MENRKSKLQAFLSSIIAGIIVAMVVYFGLNIAGYKEYRASARLVSTSLENEAGETTAEDFAKTLNSKAIKERTLENLEIDWNVAKLDNKISLTAMENSPLIEIAVVDSNKLRAEDLADEYADLSVTVINNIYNTGAEVTEYAYQEASEVDNTIRYASYAGLIGFVIYLVLALLAVGRHNSKLEKAQVKEKKEDEKKTKEQTKKNKKQIEKIEKIHEIKDEDFKPAEAKTYTPLAEEDLQNFKEEDFTKPLDQVSKPEEDLEATRKIDPADIKRKEAEKEDKKEEIKVVDKKDKSSKLEILGKIPKYQRGDLDV